MEEVKTFKLKNKSRPTNSAPKLDRTSLFNNTTQIIVAIQTLDDDHASLISWISITKTNMK